MARARVKVTIEGGDELLRKLRKKGIDVEKVLEIATIAGAKVIAAAANPLAPEPLIQEEVTDKHKGFVQVDVGPPKEKWRWQFLETGAQAHWQPRKGARLMIWPDYPGGEAGASRGHMHPGMAARPFLRPGFDSSQGRAESAIGDGLRKVIER